ncbi:SGNH/GDSL hydrolase family protein [Methylocella silvestris]|uniref:SGNH/GDSL hydrolase family protein n=1 Tax=Methylocella silvestris TaxID=199596 RepID=UPI00164F3E34|nr:SGNH/GDSL hydrolase family protein [Methylocella silvestris]
MTTTAGQFANNAAVVAAGYSHLEQALKNGGVNSVYYCTGGWPRFNATVYLVLPSGTTWSTGAGNAGSNPPLQALAPRIKFVTDSQKFVLGVTGTFRLIVNGRYVSLAPYAASGTVPAYTLVDFTAVGGRQMRQVEIEMITATSFYGVWVGPAETIWAPASGDNLRWIQNGDSLTQSAGNLPGGPGDGYSEIMADHLGVSDYRAAGIGGVGYYANNGGVNYRMQEHMFDLLNYNPDVISLAGGVNDATFGFPLAQPGLASCIAQARAYSASMPIFVTGILASVNDATALAWEIAQAAYVASLNDPNLFFIPITTDANGPWITGAGNSAAPAGNGNRDVYYDSGGPHPPTIGHQYLGLRYAPGVLAAIAGKA